MRHFYLHLPPTPTKKTKPASPHHRGFPIACVATAIVEGYERTETGSDYNKVEIRFAVSTYNPKDFKLRLPFDKTEHRNKSQGRLKSANHYVTLTLDRPSDGSELKPLHVKRAVLTDMISGTWATLHPAAIAAKEAARFWLESNPILPIINNSPFISITELVEVIQEAKVNMSRRDDLGDLQSPTEAARVPEYIGDEAATAIEEQEWRNEAKATADDPIAEPAEAKIVEVDFETLEAADFMDRMFGHAPSEEAH